MPRPLKILNVVGARPNLVKMAPLLRAMKRHKEIETFLVHTGQHYDERLSDVFFRQLEMQLPDANLGVGSGSHAEQTAEIMKRVEPLLLRYRPDLVVVVGDVNSTIAVSLTAAKLGIRIAHVEAGLRSFDRSMPEEINRMLTDALADYMFVTEECAIENLLREGRPRERIYFVGNVMIDALHQSLPLSQSSKIGDELGLVNGGGWQRFAMLTLHRPSNVDSVETLHGLLEGIVAVAEEIPVIFPVHPRTKEKLDSSKVAAHPRLQLIPPLGYLEFLSLMSHATMVLTDSGGIQEETTALGVPCLTLRNNTERPVTISHGTNQLVGTDPAKIMRAAQDVLENGRKPGRLPPLWDGKAAERIVETILTITEM
jgi:UDP-N-acetylglucosamine 2-epimerase (non-hydrolysing)